MQLREYRNCHFHFKMIKYHHQIEMTIIAVKYKIQVYVQGRNRKSEYECLIVTAYVAYYRNFHSK